MTDTQAAATKAAEHYTALAAQVKAERADILLRAAAPDLLAALEEQVDECFDDMCEMCARHQRIIAKAKGE